MKTSGLKKTMTAAGLLFVALNFTACVEYTEPLCNAENLEDISGLAGSKSLYSLDKDYKMSQQTYEIDHVSKGTYFGGAIQTCRVASNYVMQARTKEGTYSVLAVTPGPTSLSISTLVVGSEELKQGGVRYEIIEREQNLLNPKLASMMAIGNFAKSKQRVMVVDNSTPESRAVIEKYAVPFSLGAVLK